ncbi:hypothetical protein [Winogradskyella sp. PE311]|uniref:hypothetical protein n=1 Tax=Winogradskyella sp. PE311 TaxID=3366943 RepID=UPI00397EBCC8
MKLKSVIYTVIVTLFMSSVGAQVKNEKEERVEPSSFPTIAKTVIDVLPDKCKRLKFYKERDNNKISFEVKFKYNQKRYSLEFSKDGYIEDIEVVTKFKKIETLSKRHIEAYFKLNFTKHRFIKIQKQFVYSNAYSATQFVLDVLSQNSKVANQFEIIAEVNSAKKREIAEFTFSSSGKFQNIRLIEPTSYEHVLY